jgi:hypothetical protein
LTPSTSEPKVELFQSEGDEQPSNRLYTKNLFESQQMRLFMSHFEKEEQIFENPRINLSPEVEVTHVMRAIGEAPDTSASSDEDEDEEMEPLTDYIYPDQIRWS